MKVLQTQTIRGIDSVLAKAENELELRFINTEARDAFILWLAALKEDARRSSAERYEEVRRQMDAADVAQIE